MKLMSLTLSQIPDSGFNPYNYRSATDYPTFLCRDELHCFFNFPFNTKTITVIAYDKPHKDRVKVTRKSDCLCVDEQAIVASYKMYQLVESLLKEREAIYVELWYEL